MPPRPWLEPHLLDSSLEGSSEANTGEAIAAFPGKLQATAEYLVNLPKETAKKAQAFADGVSNVVTNVVSFPGRVKARAFKGSFGIPFSLWRSRPRRTTW